MRQVEDDPILQLLHDFKVARAKAAILLMMQKQGGLIIYHQLHQLRPWRWPQLKSSFQPTSAMFDAIAELIDEKAMDMRYDKEFGYWLSERG